jgi:hypothetical protein
MLKKSGMLPRDGVGGHGVELVYIPVEEDLITFYTNFLGSFFAKVEGRDALYFRCPLCNL